MKDLPGEEQHPLFSFHPHHQKQGGEQTSEGKDLADEIFYVFVHSEIFTCSHDIFYILYNEICYVSQ